MWRQRKRKKVECGGNERGKKWKVGEKKGKMWNV